MARAETISTRLRRISALERQLETLATTAEIVTSTGPGARLDRAVAFFRERAREQGLSGARLGAVTRAAREYVSRVRRERELERRRELAFERRRIEQERLSAKKQLTKAEERRLEALESEVGGRPGSCVTPGRTSQSMARVIQLMVAKAREILLQRRIDQSVFERRAAATEVTGDCCSLDKAGRVEGVITFDLDVGPAFRGSLPSTYSPVGDDDLAAVEVAASLMTIKDESKNSFRGRYFMFCNDDRQTFIRAEARITDDRVIAKYKGDGEERKRSSSFWIPTRWKPYQTGKANRLIGRNGIQRAMSVLMFNVLKALEDAYTDFEESPYQYAEQNAVAFRIRIVRADNPPPLVSRKGRDVFLNRNKDVKTPRSKAGTTKKKAK